MSAAEIIELIKALPLEEQLEVSRFVHTHVDTARKNSAATEPIESIAARIFDRYDPLFKKLAE